MFQYPETSLTPKWLTKFNRQAADNLFHAGRFGLAMDVWRDSDHLFRNYDVAHAESIDEWCRRNYPAVANPDHGSCGMGVPLVAGLDRFPVPMRAACGGHYSLTAIRTILQAALATGQYPFPPENGQLVPKANALRQRMIGVEVDWLRVNIVDIESQVAIRAIILNKGQATPQHTMATYEAKLEKREGSTLETKLTPRVVDFRAPDHDLGKTATRRPIIKEAKEQFDLIGLAGRITASTPTMARFTMATEPFDLTVTKVFVDEATKPVHLEGTLDL